MKVYCVHSNDFTAQSLAQTLNGIGTGIEAIPQATTGLPDLLDGVFLSDALYDLPTQRTVILGEAPVRLKTLVAQLRQKQVQAESPRDIAFGDYRLDMVTRDFFKPNDVVALTEKEAAILFYLFQNGPATRDDLLRDVWEYANGVDTHTIETHIYRLRQKIEANPENPDILVTTKEGYALEAASKA